MAFVIFLNLLMIHLTSRIPPAIAATFSSVTAALVRITGSSCSFGSAV